MGEGWLIDRDRRWVCRFHRDERAWSLDPKVFVDHGRGMPNGEPALLKRREHLPKDEASKLWTRLIKSGWSITEPVWGADVEP